MENKYKSLKYACYSANISMSVVSNLTPVLLLTFRNMYGISYSMLGFLILINFSTQLATDLVFSFFSHKFNIEKTVRFIPVLTFWGLIIYGVFPFVFKDAVYVGLLLGTLIFAASGGLVEVLISPVIAAIPAKDPDREMSKLHSVYAWGVVFVVIVSTLFLLFFGSEKWQWLVLMLAVIPIISAVLFAVSEIPEMETPKKVSGALELLKNKRLWLCVAAIFLGGASECTMAQWSSGYLERALDIPKVWGDIFGVAFFSVMLGMGRTIYSKTGKNIERVLFLGAIGAALCYFIAAISDIPVIGLMACGLTGFCTSMLWPGSLIVASDRFQKGGVFIYAMMASGGDFGASVGPQLVGVITDAVIKNPYAVTIAQKLSIMPEQLGMKLGMLIGMLFPLIAIFLYLHIWKTSKK